MFRTLKSTPPLVPMPTSTTVTRRYDVVGRGGKGFELIKRDRFVRAVPPEVVLLDLPERSGAGGR